MAEAKSQNAFTKSISEFRKALGQKDTSGPYIVKKPDSEGIARKFRGYVYFVNPQWKYIVIRSAKKVSEMIPT